MGEESASRVAIVGPGAIGLGLATSLHRHGNTVRLYGRTPSRSFTHVLGDREEVIPLPVHTRFEETAAADWILFCTKAHQTAGAAPWLEHLNAPRLAIVSNGVDHVERLAPFAGERALLPVIISMPSRRSDGRVTQRRVGAMTVPAGQLGEAFAALFDTESVQVSLSHDWNREAWTKLLTNAALGTCVLTGRRNGSVAAPAMTALLLDLMQEIRQVAAAEGAVIDPEMPEAVIRKILKNPEHHSSIVADRLAGRKIEWEARNAVIVERAERHGIDVPLNRMLTTLLQSVDETLG